jgi:hypothetical protein
VQRTINTGGARPLLDVATYARRGPGERINLYQAEIDLIRRTVTCTPEVMVKVLTRGGQSVGSVQRHLSYLSRKGDLEIETDDGERIFGKDAERALLDAGIWTWRSTARVRPLDLGNAETLQSWCTRFCSRCRLGRHRRGYWRRFETSRGRNLRFNTGI